MYLRVYIQGCTCICTYLFINLHTCYSLAFSQPATGPSRVCVGSDVTLQCVVVFSLNDNITIVQDSVWTRNGVLATDIPNHRQVFKEHSLI